MDKESRMQCADNRSQCSSGSDKHMSQELEERIRQDIAELHAKPMTKALAPLMAEEDATKDAAPLRLMTQISGVKFQT